MSDPAKILFLDIETAPNLGYVWGMWEQNVIDFKKNWYMLSFAYKWQGEKKVTTHVLSDFLGYNRDKENDKELVRKLWSLLDQADIVIAHNGDRFDLRKSNARFITHGFKPPSPYKSIDTLKIARKHFAFDSNKLDDLGKYLGVGRKIPHTGKHLWFGCMAGDKKSWAIMRKYNAHDVELLERVYLKLRAWATGHPKLNHYTRTSSCPTCQSKQLRPRGFMYTATGKRARMSCDSCGAWSTTGPLLKR